MKKPSIFAMLFALALQVDVSAEPPRPTYCSWGAGGIADYIDYIPGDSVIRRGFGFGDNGDFIGYCSFDTLAVSDLLLGTGGENESVIIGMIDDTLMTVCDSASVVGYFQSRYGHRYYADWLTECNEANKVFSILPIEVFKNELNLPVDTLAGFLANSHSEI